MGTPAIGTQPWPTVVDQQSNAGGAPPSCAAAAGAASQHLTFISAAPAGAQVGGSYTPTVLASSGLPVTVTVDAAASGCELSGDVVQFTGPGTCVLDANQPGDALYQPAPQVQQSFAVSLDAQSVTFTSSPPYDPVVGMVYVAQQHSSGLPVTFSRDARLGGLPGLGRRG